jgi:nucleoside-triphosphatase THEP1
MMEKEYYESHKIIDNLISQILSEEINEENIRKGFNFLTLLGKDALLKAQEEANYKWQKYLAKRGKELQKRELPDFSNRYVSYYVHRYIVDDVLRYILGYFGIGGGQVVDYFDLAYSIFSTMKNKRPSQWVNEIKNKIKIWVEIKGKNEEVVKAVAMASARLSYSLLYGSL